MSRSSSTLASFPSLPRVVVALACALASTMLCARPVDALVSSSGRLRDAPIDIDALVHGDASERARANDANPLAAAAGYFKLNSTNDAHMFYIFFPIRSQPDDEESVDARDAPLVIWLTGGPGCSSELALLYENGPYELGEDMKLKQREYGWDVAANVIFVDSPVGTGFSYSSSRKDAARDEVVVANDLLEFLQEFLLTRPELADNEVFVTGESYAGHYVPAFAHRIYESIQNDEGPVLINLIGLAIGNGLTDPAIQYGAYADYSIGNDIVSAKAAEDATKKFPECRVAIEQCVNAPKWATKKSTREKCLNAVELCEAIPEILLEDAAERNGGEALNVYDIRKSCQGDLCYDFSRAEEYLNRPEVQKALGVNKPWAMCDNQVHSDMMGDWMNDYEPMIPPMLESGIRVMIYAGESDFICNWLGNLRWVRAMDWSGKDGFNAAHAYPFVTDTAGSSDVVAGEVREYENLSFVKVSQAGHMVPMDQPRNSLVMIQRFIKGVPIARGMDDSKDASVKIASDVSVQKAPRRAAEESITFVA
jgi:serine carboxypeptidase-like clade IV